MSLFERISNKIKDDLIIEMNKTGDDDPWDDKDTKTENKKKANQKKKFNKKEKIESGTYNYSKDKNKNKKPTEKELANRRRNPELNRQQRISRMYDAYDDGDLGNPGDSKAQTTTQKTPPKNRAPRKGVDYFFDAEKAKKERDAFQQGRKAYTDSKSGIKAGKVTQKGIVNYITKARDLNQGTNANTKANRKAAEIIAKSSGSEYAEKIRQKYETDKDLSRKRPSNAKSLEQIKKEIDSRPPDGRTTKTKTKVKTPPPYKRIETKVTDKEIQDLIKKGKEAIPKKSTKVTPTNIEKIGKAKQGLDDLLIGAKAGEVEKTKKLLRKQQRIVTKRITTPSAKEIEQSQKILNKVQTKPKITKPKVTKVKGNLFDPTGRIADQTKKANQSFKDFLRKLKTKHPKPKLSLYDPLKNKIPNLEPLKPLKKPFIKPSVTKTATKSKDLLPKLMKALRKNPKTALGVGLLTLGTYGMVKNRKKAPVKNNNKNLTPIPTKKDEIITRPVSKTFNITGDASRKPIPPKKM